MRIYKVMLEHKHYGRDWSSEKVAARTCEEAIRKALVLADNKQVRVEEVQLLAAED